MAKKTKIAYEGNATAEYPLRTAGDIGPRDRLPNDPVKIGCIFAAASQIVDEKISKRCKPCSESSSGVQYSYMKKKFQDELTLHSEHYSFVSRVEIEFCILRLENLKLHWTTSNRFSSSRKNPIYTHA
tara:strand:+ start:1021 stop:1404 length:384 start_codon:yes stop_codon:yes gene_type:complete